MPPQTVRPSAPRRVVLAAAAPALLALGGCTQSGGSGGSGGPGGPGGSGSTGSTSRASDTTATTPAAPTGSVAGPRTTVHVTGTALLDRRSAYLQDALVAIPLVRQVWGSGSLPARVVVIAPASAAQFSALTGSTDRDLPALTRPDETIVLHPRLWDRTSPAGRRVVMTHELVHVALRQGRWSQAPRWAVEGPAEVTAYRSTGLTPGQIAPEVLARVRAGRGPSGPPSDAEVAGAGGYGLAWAWCRFLVARGGWARFVRFVEAAGPGDADDLARAFHTTYAVSPQRYAAGYRSWLSSWS